MGPSFCAELIEEVRRRMQLAATGKRDTGIILEGLLGEGTFGKVYKGMSIQQPTAVLPCHHPMCRGFCQCAVQCCAVRLFRHCNSLVWFTAIVCAVTWPGVLHLQGIGRGRWLL